MITKEEITQEQFNQIVQLAYTAYQLEQKAMEHGDRIEYLRNAIQHSSTEIAALEVILRDHPDDEKSKNQIKEMQKQRALRLKRLEWYPNSAKAYLDYVSKFNIHIRLRDPQARIDDHDDSLAKTPFDTAKGSIHFLIVFVRALNKSFHTEYKYTLENGSSNNAVPIEKVLSSIVAKPKSKHEPETQEENLTGQTSSSPSFGKTK